MGGSPKSADGSIDTKPEDKISAGGAVKNYLYNSYVAPMKDVVNDVTHPMDSAGAIARSYSPDTAVANQAQTDLHSTQRKPLPAWWTAGGKGR